MFFKTENTSYRVYRFDGDSFSGSNLKGSFINAQKFNFEDKVRGVSYLVNSSIAQKNRLNGSYNISNVNGAIRIANKNDSSEYMDVALYKKDNAVTGSIIGNYSNTFVKDVIRDFLMFVLPDTYEQVGRMTESSD